MDSEPPTMDPLVEDYRGFDGPTILQLGRSGLAAKRGRSSLRSDPAVAVTGELALAAWVLLLWRYSRTTEVSTAVALSDGEVCPWRQQIDASMPVDSWCATVGERVAQYGGVGNRVQELRTKLGLAEDAAMWSTLLSCGVTAPALPESLQLQLSVDPATGFLRLDYWQDRLDPAHAERFLAQFERLLIQLQAGGDAAVADLEYLTDEEARQLRTGLQVELAPGFARDCIHTSFLAQAAQRAGMPALSCAGDRWSYAELEQEARQVAFCLIARGVRPGDRVGVCMPRSRDLVSTLLGILMAGGSYVPLDPDYPPDRLAFMVQDAAMTVIVTSEDLRASLGETEAELCCLAADAVPATAVDLPDVSPEDLCYVIYTSGSTGRPKGVEVRHRNVMNFIEGITSDLTYTPGDRWLAVTSVSFDMSIVEIFWSLCHGLEVVLHEGLRRESRGGSVAELLLRHEITHFQCTPSQAQALVEDEEGRQGLAGLRQMLLGGEAVPPSLARELTGLVQGRVLNGYGPTETVAIAVGHTFRGDGDLDPVPIGRPIANTLAYVLDEDLRPVPRGVVGELYLGGHGVVRGYLGREELTAERFLRDPFRTDAGATMYRTGDLVRWREDDLLDYLGRCDTQVKLHGFRIELAEIEAQIDLVDWVHEVVVLRREDREGHAYLAAYVSRRDGATGSIEALEAHLREVLPAYMVPSRYVELDRLPVTPNGKLDRNNLPEPDAHVAAAPPVGAADPTRLLLAGIWSALLGAPPEGDGADFFAAGGNSILGLRLLSRIKKELGGKLSMAQLFDARSFGALADLLSADRHTGEPDAARTLAAIWEELLGSAPADEAADFLAAGGNSILALRLASRLRKEFGLRMSIAGFLARPRFGALLALLERGAEPAAADPAPVQATPVAPPAGRLRAPASDNQRRFWLLDQMMPGRNAYTNVICLQLRGGVDAARLQRALDLLVGWHEILRTHLELVDGELLQVVEPDSGIRIERLDLDAARARECLAAGRAPAEVVERANQWIDCQGGQLSHAALFELGGDCHVFVLCLHHIVSDGWTMGYLQAALLDNYTRLTRGEVPPRPAAAQEYRDGYPRLAPADAARHRAFWRGELSQPRARLRFASDRPRPAELRREGMSVFARLPELSRVQQVARTRRSTAYALLLSAFQVVCYRFSGVAEFFVSTPATLREPDEHGACPGPMINTLPVPAALAPELTFSGVLAQTQESLIQALEHRALPFEAMLEELPEALRPEGAGLFPLLFALDELRSATPTEAAGLEVAPLEVPMSTAVTEFSVWMLPAHDHLQARFEFNSELYDEAFIRRLVSAYELLLDAVLQDPDRSIGALPVMTPEVERDLCIARNQTAVEYPEQTTVHAAVAAQATRSPERPALVHGDVQLSYAALQARVEAWAPRLRELGAGPGVIVGVCMDPGLDLVTGLLAVMAAGGAYLPLDPAYPRERLELMVEDSGAPLVLCTSSTAARLEGAAAKLLSVDTGLAGTGTAAAAPHGPEGDLAYTIYTSGSTGRPKGVLLEHRNVSNFLTAMDAVIRPQGPGVWLATTSMSFDISVLEMFWTLSRGFTVHLPASMQTAGLQTAQDLVTSGADHFQCTPSQARMILADPRGPQALAQLRCMLVGGEALPSDLQQALRAHLGGRLINVYGPTETTVWSTWHEVSDADRHTVPIGRPLANTRLYVLDPQQRPVVQGVVGELYIGGAGVARGYHERPELTAERFLDDPFAVEPGNRMYRTGDLCRYREDGSLEFVGRTDAQVKLRGHRIELGEIEAQLEHLDGIAAAAVTVCEVAPGDRRLVAYVVADAARDADSIRADLARRVPDYMVPGHVRHLPSLPLTPNGKVDRRRLPAPELGGVAGGHAGRAPREGWESELLPIWKTVLGTQELSVDDNFFAVGGHSLLAVRLFGELRVRFGVDMVLGTILRTPTIAELAAHLESEHGSPQAAAAGTPGVLDRIKSWWRRR